MNKRNAYKVGRFFNSLIFGKDKKRVIKSILKIFKSGRNLTELSYRIVRKDASLRHIGISTSIINGADVKGYGLRTIVRDIDKRKKYEKDIFISGHHHFLR